MKTSLCYTSMNLFKMDVDYIGPRGMMLNESNGSEAINIHIQ